MQMLLVRCPNCKHQMKYQPRTHTKTLKKKCVYCGRSFTIKTH
ncbi:MAG: hypothetical protein ACOCQQ_00080 [Candidatus Nanoarchaeia archaeon]